MKTFNKIISLALCVFMLCSVMVMPAFAEGEAVMLATSGDIGNQVHWDYADGVLTLSKPEGFTGKWDYQYFNYINDVKVDGGKVVDVSNISNEVSAGNRVYKVASPWGKYTFNTTAEADGSYMAASVDYTHITKIVIGEGIESVPHFAFCTNNAAGSPSHTAATEVVFPTSIKWIGSNSFKKVGLTSLNLENTSLEKIYGSAFQDCPIAGKVVMPKTLTEIGSSAFRTWDGKCGAITQFIVPAESTISSIGDGTFDAQDKLEYVVLPASVTSIGNYSFRQNSAKVNQVLFLGNAPTISTNIAPPFVDNTKVYYSDKATGWDDAAVTTNTGLTAANVIKVSNIPSTFTDCGGINTTGLWFYDSETKTLDICGNGTAHWAYDERPWGTAICAEVENVRINDGVDLNENGVYYFKSNGPATADKDCPNIKTMYIGKDVKKVPNQFMNASKLETLTFSPESKLEAVVGNSFAGNKLTEVILPDTVVSIASQAFDTTWNTRKLEKIYLGKALTTIGDYAFRNHVAESIVIPATVTSIGQYAFSNARGDNASNTKAIYFEGETAPTTIGTSAFDNCGNAKLFVKNSTVLPDGIGIAVGSENMTLTSNVLPASKIYADLTLTDGKASARIYNFSDASKKFDIYSAAYDLNSALTAVTTQSATVDAGNKIPVITDLSTTTSGATKAFLWDSNLAPFAVVQ